MRLKAKQREALCRRRSVAAGKLRRAKILLMADENHPDGRRPDWQIAEAVGICERQVVRIRQQFVREEDPTLERKPRADAGVRKRQDAKAEAMLVGAEQPPAAGCRRYGARATATVGIESLSSTGVDDRAAGASAKVVAAAERRALQRPRPAWGRQLPSAGVHTSYVSATMSTKPLRRSVTNSEEPALFFRDCWWLVDG